MNPVHSSLPPTGGPPRRHLASFTPNSPAVTAHTAPRLVPTPPSSSAHSARSSTRITVAGAPTVKTTPGSSSSRSFTSTQPSLQNSTPSGPQSTQRSRTAQYRDRLKPNQAQPVPTFFSTYHEDRLIHHLAHYRDLLLVPSNASSYRASSPPSGSSSPKVVTLNINGLTHQKVLNICHLFMAADASFMSVTQD